NYGLPQLRGELLEGLMDSIPCLAALYVGVWGPGWIRNLFAQRLGIFVFRGSCIQRIGHAVGFGLSEVIYQQVSGNRGYPGHERAFPALVCIQSAVHLDEDLLGEVLGVVSVARKAVADVVNAPVMALDDLFPSRRIAANTAANQQSDDLGFFQ